MRMAQVAFAGCALLAAGCSAPGAGGAPQAGGSSLTGSWQGVTQGVQLQLVVQPSGAYSETATMGTMMTSQSGVVQSAGDGQIGFVVEDWQPKTQNVYTPSGDTGYYTPEAVAKPPGGIDKLQFNGPNSLTLQDVTTGATITMTRTQ
jgi:hypothetical protein